MIQIVYLMVILKFLHIDFLIYIYTNKNIAEFNIILY